MTTRRFDRLGWAMSQAGLSCAQKCVLIVLADAAAEHDGTCFLAYSTIAERASCGVTTVRDAVRELASRQLLEVTPRMFDNGKQTSNIYRLGCYAGVVDNADRVSGADTPKSPRVSGADRRGVGSRQHVEPTNRTNRKKNSTATQQSPSSRRAARARDDSGWSDPAAAVFASEQEDDDSAPGSRPRRGRNHGPDSAWALNGYYRQAVFIAGTGRVGNTNDGAMRKFFAEALRCKVPADVLRMMVDCFVEDPQLFNRAKGHRWKVFIANAPLLQQRAERIATTARMMDPEAEVPLEQQFGGAIPQHVLDAILAEAG